MKEGIRKKHGFHKTKDVFAFDEGLVEKQATFLLTVRPILAVFSALDRVGEEEDETEAPDPDVIKGMLEDALVFLGNTTVRLNSWRQRRFSEYLTADNTSIGGRWSPEESQQHISVLESKQRILPSRLSQGIGNHHQLIFTCAWTTPQRWPISTRGGGGHTLAIPVRDRAGTLVSCAHDRILGDSDTYSRYTQCRCRHSFSSIQPQGGMDIGSR